jgi:lipopolysaccharide/colanic/teichoic acid biosynthesis glycosyltransferase
MTIVPDFDRGDVAPVHIPSDRFSDQRGGSAMFWAAKAVADLAGALFLIPVIVVLGLCLLILNPLFNPGPLLYRQLRMGRGCQPFMAFKFRTMTEAGIVRGPDDPVEHERITPLGRILRRMGLDELPQAINVLRGEMSLIGPRPDCIHHAERFLTQIPEYRRRYSVLPGMSGLSQIQLGYAVGTEATRAKAETDLHYIAAAGFAMDLWIVWQTLLTVLSGRGD